MSDKSEEYGLTLIELLVVVAIIGILSSVVLASLSGARESARDARREQDLRNIQTALEMYRNDNDMFPQTSGPIGPDIDNEISNILSEYMQGVPQDPINSGVEDGVITDDSASFYAYSYNVRCKGTGTNFPALFVPSGLEGGNVDADDAEFTVSNGCDGLQSRVNNGDGVSTGNAYLFPLAQPE